MEGLLVLIEMAVFQQVGCIFRSNRGAGEHLNNLLSIKDQVTSFLNSYRGERANKFIAYFQNFTNTYGTLEELKEKYDSALVDDRIVSLAVATRPDCITEDIAKLLQSYSNKYYVFVELGLQTSSDITAKLINRGYKSEDFTNAVNILNKYNIDVVTHIMVGLPNEIKNDLINTITFLNNHNIQGLKIHSTYIVKDTKLNNLYEMGKYLPISFEEYLDSLTYILTHISPNIVIHKITGDAPKDKLVAPSWNIHKKWVLNGIQKIMDEQNLYQGMYYPLKDI